MSSIKTVKLCEIAELNPRLLETLGSGALISFIPMSAVTAETASTTRGEERRYQEVCKGYTAFLDGDILVAKITPCFENGKIAQATLDHNIGFGSTEFHVIRPRDGKADARYLLHFLRQEHIRRDGEHRMTGSAGQRRVPEHFLASVEIPLLPLEEQRRIADVLDKADTLRAKRRAILAQLDALAQSIFFDMFGDIARNEKNWSLVPLPSVIYFQEGPGIRNWQFREEGIKLINVGNIVDGRLFTENTERYLDPIEVEHTYKHFLLDVGDFVVASSGVTWGKIAEVEQWHLPLCLNTSMIRFRSIRDDIDKQFIRAFVESQAFRQQIMRLITGSAQPNFGPAHLKQVRVPLPPLALQRDFARIVASIKKLKTVHQASLEKMNELFASIQHRSFRGEL
jgi:type I restriction enzyme S subunit